MIATYSRNYWIAVWELRHHDSALDSIVAMRALHSMARYCPYACIRRRAARTLIDRGLGDTLRFDPPAGERPFSRDPAA